MSVVVGSRGGYARSDAPLSARATLRPVTATIDRGAALLDNGVDAVRIGDSAGLSRRLPM
jgi:hypothetical protein